MLRPDPLLITCALTNIIAKTVSNPFEHVAPATYIAPSNRLDRRSDAAFLEGGRSPEFRLRRFRGEAN